MIDSFDCLTTEECLKIESVIYDLRKFWTPQSHNSFYTLGAASAYDSLDTYDNNVYYYAKAKLLNPILQECFGWMYEKILDVIAKHLNQPTCYTNILALPGFHIFPVPANTHIPDRKGHFDLHVKHLNWNSSKKIDLENPISFNIAIQLPQSGSGLNISKLRQEDLSSLSPLEKQQVFEKEKEFHPYKIGSINLHDGLVLHGISSMQNQQLENDRITLQGHGILCEETWQLFW